MTRRMLLPAVLVAVAAGAALPATAGASEIVGRDATHVRLEVNRHGVALVRFRAGGDTHRLLAWGARNAIAPTRARKQVHFRYDFSVPKATVRRFRNTCRRYAGPRLPKLVVACTARNGTHWALQSWRRLNRNGGWRPLRPRELHLSHWKGGLAKLWLKWDWSYEGANNRFAPYDHLYGRYTYRGRAIYGFHSTPEGSPRDTFGRNIYVDTLNSRWGRGWRRMNGFLAHRPRGNFCDSVVPSRFGRTGSPGKGTRYRATAMGPGVTPVVRWTGPPPGPYRAGPVGDPLDFVLLADHRLRFNARRDARLDAEQRRIAPAGDRCDHPH